MSIRLIHYGDKANAEIDGLLARNAALENALKFMGRNTCEYRGKGECLIDCLGTVVCDTTDLRLVHGAITEIPYVPYFKKAWARLERVR